MDVKYLIKDLLITRDLQKWINNRFKDQSKLVFNRSDLDYICASGVKFNISVDMECIEESFGDYTLNDIRYNDVVLDIGANIGGFALQAALRSKHVYALEPIRLPELEKNIILNSNNNITVIKKALGGNTKRKLIGWREQPPKFFETISFVDLVDVCGGKIDFLKCDCEGAEWQIPFDELHRFGIRHIEMEYHSFYRFQKEDLIDALSKHYDVDVHENKISKRYVNQGILKAHREVW